MKYPYFRLYVLFGVLAFLSSCALAYCLAQISPWALFAAVAAILVKVFAWLQDQAWYEYRAEVKIKKEQKPLASV